VGLPAAGVGVGHDRRSDRNAPRRSLVFALAEKINRGGARGTDSAREVTLSLHWGGKCPGLACGYRAIALCARFGIYSCAIRAAITRKIELTWVISEPIHDLLSRAHSRTCRRRRITRVIIQYRNPRRPDEGATRIIPNRLGVEAEAEKERLEKLGFVIIDISTAASRNG
jgi:hypothetical protein